MCYAFLFAGLENNSGKFQGLRSVLFMSVKKQKASQLTVSLKL